MKLRNNRSGRTSTPPWFAAAIGPILLLCTALGACLSPAAADEPLFQRAVSLGNAARPAEAGELLRSILGQNPGPTEARVWLGFLCLGRSSVPEAEAAFTAVLNQHPDHSAARLGLGITWVQKGMARQASQEFEKILADRSLGDRARIH